MSVHWQQVQRLGLAMVSQPSSHTMLFGKLPRLACQHIRLCASNFDTTKFPILPIIEKSSDSTGISLRMPGYSFDDLDRFGKVHIHKVSAMGEASRMALYAPQFSGINLPQHAQEYYQMTQSIIQERLLFMASATYNITPAFYDKKHVYNGIRILDKIVNVGRSSYQHHNVAYSELTKQLLHESIVYVVVVDRQTRKPAPVPDIFKTYVKKTATENSTLPSERLQRQTKPEKTHLSKYVVRWSDADYYHHTNQANLVRILLDGMSEVTLRDDFTKLLKGDVASYWVKKFNCHYLNESNPKDLLDIHVWEDAEDPMTLHGTLERGGTPVFQGRFEFTEPNTPVSRL